MAQSVEEILAAAGNGSSQPAPQVRTVSASDMQSKSKSGR